MKDLIQVVVISIVVMAVVLGIFAYLIGPIALTIGLAVIGLFLSHSACAIGGAWWTERTIRCGAGIAITATSKNDEYDTRKMEAVTGLVEAVVKTIPKAPQLSGGNYPQLPGSALRFEDGIFEELSGE